MSSIVGAVLQCVPGLNRANDFLPGLQTMIRSQVFSLSVVVATATREPSAAICRTGCCVLKIRVAPAEGVAEARIPPFEVDAAAVSEPAASRAATASQDLLMTRVSHHLISGKKAEGPQGASMPLNPDQGSWM